MEPIIFIPGIEATNLVNANSFGFESVWNAFDNLGTSLKTSIMGPYLEEKLQADPLYDLNIESIIERESIAKFPYEKTFNNLHKKLNINNKIKYPIYLFGYDWRLSNMENAKRLGIYVEYIKRKLKDNNVEKINFISHSMGGLVMNAYLGLINVYDHIGKIIFCAPPFHGSPYSLIHMIKGDGGLKSFLNNLFGRNEDIRKVVRTFPSIYELLPVYEKAITYEGGQELSLLNKQHWQPNIYDDIEPLFDQRLNMLKQFRSKSGLIDLAVLPVDLRQRMVVLAGINDETLIFLKASKNGNQILLNEIKKEELKAQAKDPQYLGGDGTVPAISSTIYKNEIKTIGIKKESFLDELGNNIDFHGLFLRDSRVQNILQRYILSESNAANIKEDDLTPLRGKVSHLWYSIGETVINLSPF